MKLSPAYAIIPTFLVCLFTFHYFNKKYEQPSIDWKNPLSWVETPLPPHMSRVTRAPAMAAIYEISGDCDGYERISNIKTAPGFCVGVLDQGEGLLKPRYVTEMDNGDLLLTDMASWDPMKGRIYRYKKNGERNYERELLFSPKSFATNDPRSGIIDRPNQILIGPDKLAYVGTPSAIFRFNPKSANPLNTIEAVITKLPALGLHSMKAFAFNSKKQIFINVGSVTNVCEKFGHYGKKMNSCPEVENLTQGQGQIRIYQMLSNGKFDPNFKVFAKGLRNSMALFYDEESKVLIQAENGRDSINKFNKNLLDSELPHEEINIIEEGKHYGWPYCYDNNMNNPEWPSINCKNYKAPYLLIPPHSAPLGMIKHSGKNLPKWYQNRLIVSLHGYAQYGHRLVTFLRDEKGFPTGVPLSLIYGWSTLEKKPGTPIGLFELQDGSILIVEDNNKKLLRLSYDPSLGDGKAVREIDGTIEEENSSGSNQSEIKRQQLEEVLRDPASAPAFAKFQNEIIDRHCITCHGGEYAPGIQLKKYDYIDNERRLIELSKQEELLGRISADPNYRTMPPAGFGSQKEQDRAVSLIKGWIKTLN